MQTFAIECFECLYQGLDWLLFGFINFLGIFSLFTGAKEHLAEQDVFWVANWCNEQSFDQAVHGFDPARNRCGAVGR